MSHRAASWLAWSVSSIAIACAALGGLFLILNGAQIGTKGFDYSVAGTILGISFSAVGGLIASRRPENPLGWIFLAVGLSQGLDTFDTQYGRYALVTDPGSLPGGDLMVWLATWTWAPGTGLAATLTLLLFPTGRLPSPRWRWVSWVVGAAIVLMVVPTAVVLWPLRGPSLVSELDPAQIPGGWALQLQVLGLVLVVGCMAASATSLIIRFRRSVGEERQQLKWLTYAGAVSVIAFGITIFLPGSVRVSEVWLVVSFALLVPVIPSIPVAVAIAILKYRLYNIDLLINRTLVYGTLTALLALTYFGGVAATQAIFRALTGQEQQPQLAVVVSTLVIAALFNPLRRRIQSFIDRRFYRSKYDAAKTLETFSAKLRDETDLDALNTELVGVVRETMQPAHVSLWLRPDTPLKGEQPD